MLIDTHVHINNMVKKKFDAPLTPAEITAAAAIIEQARANNVNQYINVGTSLIESQNCIALAKKYPEIFAVVGIHPNDCTANWQTDFKNLKQLVANKTTNRIVGVGECGLDMHYPEYNLTRQIDAFKAHIELALKNKLPLVIHTRDAIDETVRVLEGYKNEPLHGIIHCFSGDKDFADFALELGFVLGIGGPLTYPKNDTLREVFAIIPLDKVVLETDAPFLPPQIIRGKQNHPKYIAVIAEFLAQLRGISLQEVAKVTTHTAQTLFKLKDCHETS